ncbi:MAG: flagellar export protein FliJ [Candidatus Neomarinimicrobiota bacterium]
MAKAFRFNLQKVLDLRRMTEDMEAVRLYHARTNLDREQERLTTIEDRKNNAINDEQQSRNLSLSLNQLKITTDYVFQLNDLIDSQKHRVSASELAVEKCRAALLEASQNKQAVEKLKEHKQYQHRLAVNKKLQRDESEIALRTVRNGKQVGAVK